jgi:hypothetical protein
MRTSLTAAIRRSKSPIIVVIDYQVHPILRALLATKALATCTQSQHGPPHYLGYVSKALPMDNTDLRVDGSFLDRHEDNPFLLT